MDWDKLRIFHNVAKMKNFTHAGDSLKMSQSAVSRQIGALEAELSTTLFRRHPRGLVLTEQGEMLYEMVQSLKDNLDVTLAHIRDSDEEVVGTLKVTTTTGFGALWLVPRLEKLLQKYPYLNLDLQFEERLLNLQMREADVAIRMKAPSQSDLISRKLVNVRSYLYVAPTYVEKYGMVETLEDLRKRRLIFPNHEAPQSVAISVLIKRLMEYNISSIMHVNSYFGVLEGVLHDLGIGVLPDYITDEYPDLIRVLPEIRSDQISVYFAYPEELRHSRRVQVFRDFIKEEMAIYRQDLNKSFGG